MDVLINHPWFGSLWLMDAEYDNGHVQGKAQDDNSVDGYSWMWFPKTCIRKVRGE